MNAELHEAPRVDVPAHVVGELVRTLPSNALKAAEGRERREILVRLNPYRTAGAKVAICLADTGSGIPEEIRPHLFEPLVSQSSGCERLGLGLFLAAIHHIPGADIELEQGIGLYR